MSAVEVFLDDTPGEIRGVIRRDGRYEHILMDKEGEKAAWRLGARSVGRVVEVWPGLGGSFVDLEPGHVFLPFKPGLVAKVGEKVEIEIVAEARADKVPTGRWIGRANGEPRLLAPGPTVAEALAILAPGVTPATGRAAIEAGWEAVEDAEHAEATHDQSVLIERTRAMVTVDIDLSRHASGGAKARAEANRQGLREAARLIRLRRWGGLVAVDLVGSGHDGEAMIAAAKAAFGADPRIVYGPMNRFGVIMLSLPWGRTPLEDVLYQRRWSRFRSVDDMWLGQAALEATRRLRHALLADTTQPRVVARCAPDLAEALAPLVARLGPRAHLQVDEALSRNQNAIEIG